MANLQIADMQIDVQKLACEIASNDYGVSEFGDSEEELATQWIKKLLRLVLTHMGEAVAAERKTCESLMRQLAAEETRPEVKEALLEAWVMIKQRWLGEEG